MATPTISRPVPPVAPNTRTFISSLRSFPIDIGCTVADGEKCSARPGRGEHPSLSALLQPRLLQGYAPLLGRLDGKIPVETWVPAEQRGQAFNSSRRRRGAIPLISAQH